MNIEIITTPNEKLKETGFGGLKACRSVLEAIKRLGHSVKLSVCLTEKDLSQVVKRSPDFVVLGVKYLENKNEKNIWLSEYFLTKEISYSGSTRNILKFDSDKVLAKKHLRDKGIKTANYFTAVHGQYSSEDELPLKFPLFLKPMNAANGNGIDDLSYVTNFENFKSKILSLHKLYNRPILVEEYLEGREFTVAVIKIKDRDPIVSAVELIPPQSTNGIRILGHKTKSEDTEEMKIIDDDFLKKNVTKLALDSFKELGVRDFGRFDIKADQFGQCYFMEANLVPGMTYGSSYFPKACELESEITYDELIQLIIDGSLARSSVSVNCTNHNLI